MKKNSGRIFIICIILLGVVLSGCATIFSSTVYEKIPTKISYDISYGYRVNCSDVTKYEISYVCDVPAVILGSITNTLLYNEKYETKTLLNNTIIYWNFSGIEERSYTLGITAHVTAESYLVPDLNGVNALSIQSIHKYYPTIVKQYTRPQCNQTIPYIDPYDPDIILIAQTVLKNVEINNSFLQAQSLFVWLKENIRYQLHPGEEIVRPAAKTFLYKNGDCDDLSFLYISLCRSIGIPARFIRGYLLTAFDNGTTAAVAHAWVEVFVGGGVGNDGWVPVECACICSIEDRKIDIEQNFGIEDALHLRLFVDDGSNQSITHYVSNIAYTTYNGYIQPPQSFVEVHNYQELTSQKLVVRTDNTRYYE